MQQIFRYGFYLFLFLLPFQTVLLLREPFVRGVKWEYGMAGVYFVDILLLFFIVSFLTESSFFKKYQISNIKYQITDLILLVFLFWAGVSIFWASDQMLALYFFIKLLLAVLLFFVVRAMDIDMKKIVFVLLAAGVVQSGIGIAQFLSQQSIGSSILGISPHDASLAGSSVLKIDSGRFLRAYGTFPHPNILGGFLAVILVLCISYYVFCIQYERSWRCVAEIVATLSGMLIILLGLILTFSRTAWLGALLGIVVIGFNVIKQKDHWIRRRFLKILFALGMAGIVFGGILHAYISPRFDTATIEREGSVSERIVSLQDARLLIVEHPFIGVGGGNFTFEIMQQEPDRPVWSIQPAHNVFILIFSELGIVGLVLLVLFIFSLFKCVILLLDPGIQKVLWNLDSRLLGNDKNEHLFLKKENTPMLIGALLALIPSLFLDHFLWSSHFGLLFLFLLLGLVSRRS